MAIYDKTYMWTFSDGSKLILDASPLIIGEPLVYTGKVGESLLDIAYRFYNGHSSWYLIAMANNIIDPYQDLVGVDLIIPKNG